MNCHGGVNAATGTNHPGGVQTSCVSCHNAGQPGGAPANWGTTPAPSFVGLSWQQICTMVKNFAAGPQGRQRLDNHVRNDALIGWAFNPTSIQGRPRLPAAGNGDRSAFVQNSLRWFYGGKWCGLQPHR
jgi:hypothetical protein